MFVCRLFHRDRPFEQIDVRYLAGGQITVGRDPAADWPLSEIDPTLSRLHCTLSVVDGEVRVVDTSTNGTFLDGGVRAPPGGFAPVGLRQSIHLGAMTILVDRDDRAGGAETLNNAFQLPISAAPLPTPTEWADPPPPAAAHRDASLIEAFCQGARLDASALSGVDPNELMRRVGEIYQQTVLGLGTLMAERTRMKAEYEVDRTTLGALQNNPFKWTPTRRLAEALLCKRDAAFLSDAEAVRACFTDLTCHLAAVAEGANASLAAVMQALDPAAIEAEAKSQGGLLGAGAGACWRVHRKRYDELGEGAVRRAFSDGYNRVAEASAGG